MFIQTGRDYCVGQVLDCLAEVSAAVQNRDNAITDEYTEVQELGTFVSTIDKVSLFNIVHYLTRAHSELTSDP